MASRKTLHIVTVVMYAVGLTIVMRCLGHLKGERRIRL